MACTKTPERIVRQGMVVSPSPLASQVGVEILQAGGNAVDAAVATGLALGVVDQFNSGLGGGAFLVIHMADGKTATIDGREMAPAAAHIHLYFRNGVYQPELAQTGMLAAGTPGALAGYVKALALHGTKPLGELLRPAIRLAREGFVVDQYYVERIQSVAELLRRDPASAMYFHADGTPLAPGNRLIQPDLANTYERLAQDGPDYFYRGDFAQRLDTAMREQHGIMTVQDLARYVAKVREPVRGTYRTHAVFGMPPPSSGGVHVVQILGLLDRLGEPIGSPQLARTMQYAFHDRHRYLGDPDFVDVPVTGLVADAYLDDIAARIRRHEPPSDALNAYLHAGGDHTAGFVVIDSKGNAVAATATINTTFGAKRTVPGTGVMLNNQMDDFVTNPGGVNVYGLTGSTANLVEPLKRPLSSMSPTIVTDAHGAVVMAVAAAGGPTIISGVAQTISRVMANGHAVAAAVAAPRLHHQWQPPDVFLEPQFPLWGRTQLRGAGFVTTPAPIAAKVQAIVRDPKTGVLQGASDPRAHGAAAGY